MTNYTVTKFKIIETIGDSIFNNNMEKGGTLIIKPKNNYVVSASDFSINTLPNDISSVEFFDTTTPGKIGNEVYVFAALKPDFALSKNTKIKLRILGDAKVWRVEEQNIDINIKLIDDKNVNEFGSVTVTSFGDNTVATTNNVGRDGVLDIITSIIKGNAKKNVSTKVATISVVANENYFFSSKPYLKKLNVKNVLLKQTSVTRDSNNKATAYYYDVIFKSNVNTFIEGQQPVFIEYKAVELPIIESEITHVSFGDTIVSELGETRPIKIFGTEGAEFDLTITKSSDSVSSIVSGNTKTFTPYGTISAINKKIPITSSIIKSGFCEFLQDFPMNITASTTLSGAMSNTTAMSVTSNAGVAVGDRVIMGQITGGKIIKVTVLNPAGANTLTVSGNITAGNSSNVKFIRSETYDINIYPKSGTTLGSNINQIKPNFTIKQHISPTLKLALTSSHCTNPGNVKYVGRVNKFGTELNTISGAVSGTHAVVTNYSTKDRFKITYTLAATSSIWRVADATLPKWSSTDSTASSWTNSVYKDTVSKYGASTVAGNGGTHIEIFNIAATGVSSGTLTLTMDVIIKKWGTEDVTMTLDLDPAYDT